MKITNKTIITTGYRYFKSEIFNLIVYNTKKMDKNNPIIISLGGSLVVPQSGIDIQYLTLFNQFIRDKIARNWRLFIVIGGGQLARNYISAGRQIAGNLTDWDLDWLGIHSTHLNAHLLRTIFRDIAHPRIIENYEKKIRNLKEPLVIAAGWKPGCSTDFDAVTLARDYGSKTVINMSNISSVYDKDPNKYQDAKTIDRMSWKKLVELVGEKWSPGLNVPFDPVATRLAHSLGLKVFIVGRDLDNLDKVMRGKQFTGTVIE